MTNREAYERFAVRLFGQGARAEIAETSDVGLLGQILAVLNPSFETSGKSVSVLEAELQRIVFTKTGTDAWYRDRQDLTPLDLEQALTAFFDRGARTDSDDLGLLHRQLGALEQARVDAWRPRATSGRG